MRARVVRVGVGGMRCCSAFGAGAVLGGDGCADTGADGGAAGGADAGTGTAGAEVAGVVCVLDGARSPWPLRGLW
ncbi:hypothetical protein GCM10010411_27400 [Actinomadura fulvescens]|uniref:Uncharacterized protein n=1 Tax=Actinomadura fulvescens TaxID=46160 RepID=A0ABN3PNI0_9ACTN